MDRLGLVEGLCQFRAAPASSGGTLHPSTGGLTLHPSTGGLTLHPSTGALTRWPVPTNREIRKAPGRAGGRWPPAAR